MANIEFSSTNARMPMTPTSESYGSTRSGSNRLANTLENEIKDEDYYTVVAFLLFFKIITIV